MNEFHEYIKIWPFDAAPLELRILSTNGGDEDWIAVVPPHLANDWIGWLEEGSSFGCCHVRKYDHPTLPGYQVRIGCHA